MPIPGPWIVPPVTTLMVDLGHTISGGEFTAGDTFTSRRSSGLHDLTTATFVDACEDTSGILGDVAVGSQTVARRDLGSPWAVDAGQFRLKIGWAGLRDAMLTFTNIMLGTDPLHFHETWPPGAVGEEAPGYFDALTPANLRSALHVATTVPSNPHQIVTVSGPTPWTGDTFHPVSDVLELHLSTAPAADGVPGSALTSTTLLDAVALPAVFDNTVAVAAAVPVGDWRGDAIGSLYPYWVDLVLALQSQRTYAQPAWGGYASPADDTSVQETYGTLITAPTGMTLTVDWQPPTYRWIYDGTPPLRQRQRPAGTGAAAGPPLRQRGTLGDGEPPLRQRRTL